MSSDQQNWYKWVVTYLCGEPGCAIQHKEVSSGRCLKDARAFFKLSHPSAIIIDIEPSYEMPEE